MSVFLRHMLIFDNTPTGEFVTGKVYFFVVDVLMITVWMQKGVVFVSIIRFVDIISPNFLRVASPRTYFVQVSFSKVMMNDDKFILPNIPL
jgi:hypothetical protein